MKVRSVSGGLMRTVLLAGAMVAPWGLVQARTPDANALFDWAEKTYSPFFTGHPVTEDFPPYVFRRYDNGNFLAIADEKLYLLGPLTANQLQALGSVTQFSCFVYPAECGQTPPGSLGTELQEVTTFLGVCAAEHS